MKQSSEFKRILVATDFSPPADAALQQAVWLASATGASVDVLHTVPSFQRLIPSATGPDVGFQLDFLVNEGDSLEDLEAEAVRDAEVKLRRMVEHVTDPVALRPTVQIGEAYAEITHAALREGYDLVLVGTRGLAPWEQFLVGSTAKRLIRKCPSSVWIVKAEHSDPPRVVLAATDFSEASRKAAMQGVMIAEHADGVFHLLHVVDSNDVPEDLISRIPKGSSLKQEIIKEATERMDEFVETLHVDRARIQTHLLWGNPWQEIQRAVNDHAVDLVVIGTVGRSGVAGLLLGNTAEKLLDICDCSILTTKPDNFRSPLYSGS
jgi:universal stress protein E